MGALKNRSKDFWRDTISAHGGMVALEVARWDGKKGNLHWKSFLPEGKDLICKLENGGLSEHDVFLRYGKDFNNKEEADRKLTEAFAGKKETFLVLERIIPLTKLGVHSLEINTIAAPD